MAIDARDLACAGHGDQPDRTGEHLDRVVASVPAEARNVA